MRVAREIRDVWIIAGITLFMFVVLESALSLAFIIKDRLNDSEQSLPDRRVIADAYGNASWVNDYFKEFRSTSEARWTPYVYWRRPPFNGQYIHVDAGGIRRTVHLGSRHAQGSGTVRIAMFGGSTLWGTGARDAFTIPSLLAAELQKHGVATEITNYGESGYVSTQEVILLMTVLQKGDIPQLVIFYDGVNDTYSAYQERAAGFPQNESNRAQEFNLSKSNRLGSRLRMDLRDGAAMLSTTRFLNGVLKRTGIQWGERTTVNPGNFGRNAIADDDSLAHAVIDVYQANIGLVTALSRHYDFDFLFYWQPTIFQKAHPTKYETGKRE
jgi:lysophospholipase L1-like esterase